LPHDRSVDVCPPPVDDTHRTHLIRSASQRRLPAPTKSTCPVDVFHHPHLHARASGTQLPGPTLTDQPS
jgi:hypothetical protein